MATAIQKITLSSAQDIPFNKLVLSQSNVRRVKAGVSIDELAESITRRGLIQSLHVRPVLDADGQRQAAITVAEGQKQSAILKAEGDKQSQILSAEGERQAAVLRAQGFADALQAIFNTAQNVDANTMTLQYLEALKDVGTSPSTKFVLPLELTRMLDNIANMAGGGAQSNGR